MTVNLLSMRKWNTVAITLFSFFYSYMVHSKLFFFFFKLMKFFWILHIKCLAYLFHYKGEWCVKIPLKNSCPSIFPVKNTCLCSSRSLRGQMLSSLFLHMMLVSLTRVSWFANRRCSGFCVTVVPQFSLSGVS